MTKKEDQKSAVYDYLKDKREGRSEALQEDLGVIKDEAAEAESTITEKGAYGHKLRKEEERAEVMKDELGLNKKK